VEKDKAAAGAIDENFLYGAFHKDVERRNKIQGMAVRKALNLPLDDEVNNVGNRYSWGVPGWVTALLVLLGMAAPWLGVAIWKMITHPAVTSPPPGKDMDTKYDLVPLPGE
jgi:hypothetical protein